MSIHGTLKSMTFLEKVKFFIYTGIWPREVKFHNINLKEMQGIPKIKEKSPWVEVKHEDLAG